MLQPGDCVGRYEIQAVVGEGGFGKVYRAWDAELERLVAIKALSSERRASAPDQHAAYLERFEMERRVQGQFQHPHIVSVYDMVRQNGDEYLVEEYVAGGTLRALIEQEGRLLPERVVQIGAEICQAIAAAWEQDVVHRDIKPSNILLSDDGHAKLGDFGVAQVGQMSQRTQSDNHHPGTPAYMSPEQEKGYGYLDERSDLYALGLVLYEALTGKSYKRERVPMHRLAPKMPRELGRVVMRALEPDPSDRYQRTAELETALRQALDGSRSRWARWGGSALVVLALIVAGWLSARASQGQSGPTPTWPSRPAGTFTSQPTVMPSQTSTSTRVPTRTLASPITQTRTPRPSAVPTPTSAATSRPTRTPVVSSPRLISPPGASEVKTSRPTLRWEGELPNSSYGFRVSLRHSSGAPSYTSPLLDGTQWTPNLAGDAVGEWLWSVAVVRRDGTQDVLARSAEWTFYYNPFGGPSPPPPHSPLSPPVDSPLPTPTL